MASNNGLPAAASLVDVAVRAAVLAGAPRRTVAATAAAVASVVMVELRGDDGGRGAAKAPLSASKRRRMKRMKKAAKEKATSAQPTPTGDEASDGRESEGAFADTHASTPAAVLSAPAGHPPSLAPVAEDQPPNACQHCGQAFVSRNKLFEHLKETGHSKFFAPRSAGDSASISGPSAGSLERTPASRQIQGELAEAVSMESELGPKHGGSAGSSRASPYARTNTGVSPTPPQDAKLREGKGRAGRPG